MSLKLVANNLTKLSVTDKRPSRFKEFPLFHFQANNKHHLLIQLYHRPLQVYRSTDQMRIIIILSPSQVKLPIEQWNLNPYRLRSTPQPNNNQRRPTHWQNEIRKTVLSFCSFTMRRLLWVIAYAPLASPVSSSTIDPISTLKEHHGSLHCWRFQMSVLV